MQYQYAPLTGVYKPDLKEFFSLDKSRGSNHLVKNGQNRRGGESQWREVSRTNNLVLIPHSCLQIIYHTNAAVVELFQVLGIPPLSRN